MGRRSPCKTHTREFKLKLGKQAQKPTEKGGFFVTYIGG